MTKMDPRMIEAFVEAFGLNPSELRPVEVVILSQLSTLGAQVDQIKAWMHEQKGAAAALSQQAREAQQRAAARRSFWATIAAVVGSAGGLAGLGTFLTTLLRSAHRG